jgi:hypothetical protein
MIRYATIVVVIHAVVVALHGLAHEKISVPLSPLQSLVVSLIIVLAPIAAMVLLWTPFRSIRSIGGWLLFSSMAGALLFGLYHHFIAISPDHVSQIPFEDWGVLFHITAVLLLLIEGLGCGISSWALSTLQRQEQVV